jgi:Flp pilus assembly protein TadG
MSRSFKFLQPPGAKAAEFIEDQRGAAAVEIAIWALILAMPVLSIVDVGTYVYQRMQLENAAEMAVQAVWANCGPAYLPATLRCSGMSAAATSAAQTTSLGTNVTISSTTEGYYCIAGDGSLTPTGGALSAGTTTCSNGAKSADYIQITATYAYSPPFGASPVSSILGSSITKTAWMRLN